MGIITKMMQTVVTSVTVLGGLIGFIVWDARRAVKMDREIRRELRKVRKPDPGHAEAESGSE